MHHLFCGISVEPLSHYPFAPKDDGLRVFTAGDLGWTPDSAAAVRFLPCLGGFVGSDILAGVLATKLHESADLAALVDLGTNGEIVVGNRERMLCASTAAGPAFEGARIWMGMRAATGRSPRSTWKTTGCGVTCWATVRRGGICGSGVGGRGGIGAGAWLGQTQRPPGQRQRSHTGRAGEAFPNGHTRAAAREGRDCGGV